MSLDAAFQYPNSAFKIAHYLDTWTVVVSGRSIIEDLTKRPDDELSAPLGRMEARNFLLALAVMVMLTTLGPTDRITRPCRPNTCLTRRSCPIGTTCK